MEIPRGILEIIQWIKDALDWGLDIWIKLGLITRAIIESPQTFWSQNVLHRIVPGKDIRTAHWGYKYKHVFPVIKTHCCSHPVTRREKLFSNHNEPLGFVQSQAELCSS